MGLTSQFGFSKIRPPEQFIGKTLEQAGLGGIREKYGIAVMAIRRGREPILAPAKDEVIQPGDILVIAGHQEVLAKVHPT